MMYPSQPLPGDNLSSYLRRLQNYAQEGEQCKGPNGLLNRGPGGTTIGQMDDWIHPAFNQRDVFDTGSAYYINDIVRVETATTYTVAGTSYTSPVGTYICVRPVPMASMSLSPGSLPNHLSYLASLMVRDSTICYAPVSPEPSDITKVFWKQIGGGSGDTTLDDWNASGSYSAGVRVRVTGSITEYVRGTGSYWVYPCIAHCEKNTVPLSISGSVSGSLQIPYYPEPEDPAALYWKIESMAIRQISTCDGDNGITSVWSNTQEFEPSGSPRIILYWPS